MLDQQTALHSVAALYEDYQQSNSTGRGVRQIAQDPSSQALTVIENLSPNPDVLTEVLIPLRMPSFSSGSQFPSTDHERFALVRQTSPRHIDHLLEIWTVDRGSGKELDSRANGSRRRRQNEMDERRRAQQPRVESDDSSDEETPKIMSPGTGSMPREPPLPQVDTGRHEIPSTRPVPVPAQSLRPPIPMPPGSPHSLSSAHPPSYTPVSPIGSIRSAGYSPASPRSGFLDSFPNRPVPGPKARGQTKNGLKIPWRLCLASTAGIHYWDFVDDRMVGSNSQMEYSMAQSDRNTWTEIVTSWVNKEALDEAGYGYIQFQRDAGDPRRTRSETCFQILRPLTFVSKHLKYYPGHLAY